MLAPFHDRARKRRSSASLLDGLAVLDFTRVLAGPYCTRLLADLGARVIKIERPGEGDEIRYSVTQLEPGRTDQSSYFVRLNAGKNGIAIDLAHPQARDVVLDLARLADVVVENFSPGIMARYGLDDAALRTVRRDLVYCSISGFGQTGPLGSMQAYAHLINAISGMMDMEHGAARVSPGRRTCRPRTCWRGPTHSARSARRCCGARAAGKAPISTCRCSSV